MPAEEKGTAEQSITPSMTLKEELLQSAVDASKELVLSQPGSQQDAKVQILPLKQIKPSQRKQLEYVSAVALKYGHLSHQSTLQFAESLIARLRKAEKTPEAGMQKTSHHDTVLGEIQPHFDLEIAPPGWITFRLAASGLAIWLQVLMEYPLPVAKDTLTTFPETRSFLETAMPARNSTSVFPILHTYARCQSLLRLGQQLELMQVRQISSPSELIQTPNPLPWLLPTGEFRGNQSAEWQLIEQLCATLDYCASDPLTPDLTPDPFVQPEAPLDLSARVGEILKQADRLSQSWQLFYAECRIADEIQKNDPAQAQIRLGLTYITQKMLHYLLRSIGLPTPLFL